MSENKLLTLSFEFAVNIVKLVDTIKMPKSSYIKHVTYFLAQYSNQTPKLQESEISSVIVANYNTALNMLTYNSLKAILTNAHEFLNKLKLNR